MVTILIETVVRAKTERSALKRQMQATGTAACEACFARHVAHMLGPIVIGTIDGIIDIVYLHVF